MRSGLFVLAVVGGLAGPAVSQCDPVFVGSYPLSLASAVHLEGTTAYVTNSALGLYLINVADPAHPSLIGWVDPSSQARNVDVQGDLALLAGGFSIEVECIGLSNPAAPSILGKLDAPDAHWSGNDVEMMGGYAYVAEQNDTAPPHALRVLDISSPASPALLNTVYTPGQPKALWREGTRLYLADGGGAFQSGLLVYDISVPTAPALLGRFNTSDYAIDVKVVGDLAYVSDYEDGMDIIDVSDPANMSLVGSIDFTYYCYGLGVSNGVAYIANWSNGLRVVDVSDPTHPTLIRTIDLSDIPLDVQISGNYLYVAWRSLGLRIYDISGCGTPAPCNDADFSAPFGTLDLADITAFVAAFMGQDAAADLEPDGLFDLLDVLAFVGAFSGGCP
ncbi:MAG: hypothetical protein H6810_05210 [Phycisphaeraceae bacterium]|nr:MAG: hypothetical protein H6810_05210 [Phycisphaeraceae bacterium]